MARRFLTALPVYNEARHLTAVLDEVKRYSPDVLVVDDGSSDDTPRLLEERGDVFVARHPKNRGYGAALKTAFQYALDEGYDIIVTIDCDGQHEPMRIPQFVEACRGVDIVSGSRYLKSFDADTPPPEQRRRINAMLTEELNRRLGFELTDAFCGFKAYCVRALSQLHLSEEGYAMPLELWVQAWAAKMRIVELPVPLIYLDERRSFGGALDDAERRMAYYREVLDRSMEAVVAHQASSAAAITGVPASGLCSTPTLTATPRCHE
jgi:dolichol-phosphate mannosyltransferase